MFKAVVLFILTLTTVPANSTDGDDSLILLIPALIASTANCDSSDLSTCKNANACEKASGHWVNSICQSRPLALTQISKLPGDWYFDQHSENGSISVDEFRFYRNTINSDDISVYTILGDEFLGNFSFSRDHPVGAAYGEESKIFVVLSQWAFPDTEFGSVYVFKSATANTSGFDCHYFSDAMGNIRDYYIGFGGSIPCDSLTKRKRSSAKQASSVRTEQLSKNSVDRISLMTRRDRENKAKSNSSNAHSAKTKIDHKLKETISSLSGALLSNSVN